MATNTSINTILLSDLIRTAIIVPIMDKYMLIILYIFGIIGSLLNIITLLQKQFRNNPCSLYFVSASITDFNIMNLVLFMDLLRYINTKYFVYINSFTIWCQLGKYFTFVLPCLSSTYIILASIDRFSASSHRQKFRKFSQIKVSRILIPLLFIIWILFSSHILILFYILPYTPISTYQCTYIRNLYIFYLIIDGYFFALFNGMIIPILLAIFGLLIYRNVEQSRRRTVPIRNTSINRIIISGSNPNLNRYNLHLITMLLVQSSLTIFLNIPYMTIYLNGFYNNAPTNQFTLIFYIIFTYMARWFWFINYCKTFYLNTLSSKIFRKTLKQQLINFIIWLKTIIII